MDFAHFTEKIAARVAVARCTTTAWLALLINTLALLPMQTTQAQALPLHTVATMPGIVTETSGLIATGPNRLWTHNDSGGEAKLYQIDTTGALLRTVVVVGTPNIDWEELTQDLAGNVYIGDFGNNNNDRTGLVILKLPPLDGLVADSVVPDRIDFHYPDQTTFPPADSLKNYDMEAMVALGDSIYLFSKNRTVPFDGYTRLYRLPQVAGNYAAELIDSFYAGPGPMLNDWICGAALNPAQDQLVLLSYAHCWIFSCFEGADFFGGSVVERNWTFTQKEAAAWRDSTHLYITDELLNGVLGGKLYLADMTAFAQAPAAYLGPDTLYVGDTLWLSAPSNPGGSYLWSTGATTATVPLTLPGSYWVQVTAANGCMASDTIEVDIVAHLASSISGMRLQASPNPFTDVTTVKISLPDDALVRWELLDAAGRLVSTGESPTVVRSLELTLGDDCPSGIYVFRVHTAAGAAAIRLMHW